MFKKFWLMIVFVIILANYACAGNPFQYPIFQAIDADGNPIAGGFVYTYESGTSTPKVAYKDEALTIPAENPIELDEKGEYTFYLSGAYKINVKTSADLQVGGFPIEYTEVSTSEGGDQLQRYDTIAALRLATGTAGQVVNVTGYYDASDGNGGPQRYWNVDTYGSLDDDGCGTIVPTSVTTGAWLMVGISSLAIDDCGAVGDWNGSTGTDDADSFNNAAAHALEVGATLTDKGKDYYIETVLELSSNADFKGTFIITSAAPDNVLRILPIETPVALDATLMSGLDEGSTDISSTGTQLEGYLGGTLIISSTETLIERYDPTLVLYQPYTRNDAQILTNENGTEIAPAIDSTYSNYALITAYIKPYEEPITINNLSVELHGTAHYTNYAINNTKDNVTYNNLSLVNKTTDKNLEDWISINTCTGIVFNKPIILDNLKTTTGDNYGLSIGNTAYTTINNATITTSTSITGRHSKKVFINGGVYQIVDNHWGNDFNLIDATFYQPVVYAGSNISIKNCSIYGSPVLFVRPDTPELKGRVTIAKNKLITASASPYVIAFDNIEVTDSSFFGRPLYRPDYVLIEDNIIESSHATPLSITMYNGEWRANYQHYQVKKLIIRNNSYSDLDLGLLLKKDDQYTWGIYFSKIFIENEETNGTIANPYIVIRDDSPTLTNYNGYNLTFKDCTDLSILCDFPAVNRITIHGGSIKYIWKVNTKSPIVDMGFLYVDNAELKAATMQYMKFVFSNCVASGINTVTPGDYALTRNNNVIKDGTISSSFYTNYVNATYFDF